MMLPSLLLSLAASALAQTECPEKTTSICSSPTDMLCDMGMTGPCWNGDYCMPESSVCPTPCYSPLPSSCAATQLVCDMGMTGNCWNGDYCMPEGSVCPPACNTPEPSVCGMTDILCDMGMDDNGCWMGDICMP